MSQAKEEERFDSTIAAITGELSKLKGVEEKFQASGTALWVVICLVLGTMGSFLYAFINQSLGPIGLSALFGVFVLSTVVFLCMPRGPGVIAHRFMLPLDFLQAASAHLTPGQACQLHFGYREFGEWRGYGTFDFQFPWLQLETQSADGTKVSLRVTREGKYQAWASATYKGSGRSHPCYRGTWTETAQLRLERPEVEAGDREALQPPPPANQLTVSGWTNGREVELNLVGTAQTQETHPAPGSISGKDLGALLDYGLKALQEARTVGCC